MTNAEIKRRMAPIKTMMERLVRDLHDESEVHVLAVLRVDRCEPENKQTAVDGAFYVTACPNGIISYGALVTEKLNEALVAGEGIDPILPGAGGFLN